MHVCRARERAVQHCQLCHHAFSSTKALKNHTCHKDGQQEGVLVQLCLECGQFFRDNTPHVCQGQQQHAEVVQQLALQGVDLKKHSKKPSIHVQVTSEGHLIDPAMAQLVTDGDNVNVNGTDNITVQVISTEDVTMAQEDVTTAQEDITTAQEDVTMAQVDATTAQEDVAREDVTIAQDDVVYMCGVCHQTFYSETHVHEHMTEHGLVAESSLLAVQKGEEALEQEPQSQDLEAVAEALAELQG